MFHIKICIIKVPYPDRLRSTERIKQDFTQNPMFSSVEKSIS